MSVRRLRSMDTQMLERYSPRSVLGDGNCFYRAMSLALFGTEDFHGYLRVRTAIEIMSNNCLYSSDSAAFVLRDLPILTPAYGQLIRESVVDGTSSEMVHLFAFSKAFGIDIQSYCCPFSLSSPHPYTLQIHSSSYAQVFSTGNVTLMWTPLDTDKEPNHFVLLVPYGESTGLNSVIESAESPSAAEIPNDEMNVSNSCPEENEVLFRFLHYLLLRFCSP